MDKEIAHEIQCRNFYCFNAQAGTPCTSAYFRWHFNQFYVLHIKILSLVAGYTGKNGQVSKEGR
jgi:hypothetical protein